MRKVALGWIALLFLLGCAAGDRAEAPAKYAPTVHIETVDLDNDGEREVVIENEYLKIVALLPKTKGEEKYAARFVWGGWVADLIFKPAQCNYVVGRYFPQGQIDWDHPHYLGLPDQFEKPILLEEANDVRRELLIGVGVLTRRKLAEGKWSQPELELAGPWGFEVEDRPGGAKAVHFTQNLTTAYGYAYELKRTIFIGPGESTFRIETTLRNSGKKPMDTDWYLHPFFSFGGFAGECWQEIPLSLGQDGLVRLESWAMPMMEGEGTVWGWLTPSELGGKKWFATGCRGEDLFFAASWSFPLLRLRTWLRGHTYAIEPFTKLDLPPEKECTWHVDVIAGSQMWRAAHVNRDGALDISIPEEKMCEIAFMPTGYRRDVVVHTRFEDRNGRLVSEKDRIIPNCAPDKPGRVVLDIPSFEPPVSFVTATVSIDKNRVIEAARAVGAVEARLGEPPRRLSGRKALLVADAADRTRKNELLYLSAALRREGMKVEEAAPSELPANLEGYNVVAVLSAEALPADRIARYVESGGGLFATPPFDKEFLKLLPIEGGTEAVELKDWPQMPAQSGDPRTENIPALRVHLIPKGDHPVTRNLPFYPATFQSIASFYRAKAKGAAEVLVCYSSDNSPALILDPKRRIAVFMSPVMWGQPAHWILWGTFAEYHRELMTRIVAWCCGD